MKKNYLKPEIQVCNIENQEILAGSMGIHDEVSGSEQLVNTQEKYPSIWDWFLGHWDALETYNRKEEIIINLLF